MTSCAAIWTLTATLFAQICVSYSANILMYQVLASKSHTFTFIPLANALTERGHTITHISAFPPDSKQKYTHIAPELAVQEFEKYIAIADSFGNRVNHPYINIFGFIEPLVLSSLACEAFLNSNSTQDIASNKIKYDLIIIDTLSNECIFGLAHLQNTPMIYYSTSFLYPWHTASMGLPPVAAYIPSFNPVTGSNDFRKLTNRVIYVLTDLLRNWYTRKINFPKLEKLWEDKTGRNMPSFEALERNIGLMLVNAHSSVKVAQPYLPGIIDIGGIHVKPSKPLPKDLESVVNGSGDAGFILFALGTITNANMMPKEYFKIFVDAFSKLPQRVIWKFDLPEDRKKDLPPNLFMLNWLPQTDLLAHPKCKGFISHGGMLSFLEAVTHAVPMVIIPFYADQDTQANFAETYNIGKYLEISSVTTENFHNAIKDIVTDPKYKSNMLKHSALLRDRQSSPMDTAIYWVEWAMRHKDSTSLLPDAREWSWFSFYLVDVWIIIGFSLFVLLYVSYKLTRCFLSMISWCICGKKSTEIKKKKVKRN